MISGVTAICGRSGDVDEFYDDYEEERLFDATEFMNGPREFYWTPSLQRSFREELEKWVQSLQPTRLTDHLRCQIGYFG